MWFCRRLIGFASLFVPSELRRDWREEWESELWHEGQGGRGSLRMLLRCCGALRHALWLRASGWRGDLPREELRWAMRSLRAQPLFATIAIATLAVGIGGTSAAFSLIDSVVLRPLPFEAPDRLVSVRSVFSGGDQAPVSPPDYVDYRESNRVFASFAAMLRWSRALTLTGGDAPQVVTSSSITSNFFETLGVEPLIGRGFTEEEERVAVTGVVVLAEPFWRGRFGADRGVLGTDIVLNGAAHTIVGVMPAGKTLPAGADVWLPLPFESPELAVRAAHSLRPIGRLRAGVSIEQAQADMDAIAVRLEAAYPRSNTSWRVGLDPLRDVVVGRAGISLLILLAAVGLVLLVACANVANLMLARASSRQGEVAVRMALGATRGRLFRQFIVEALLIAAAAGAAGVALAFALVGIVRRAGGINIPRLSEVAIDVRAIGFALALSVIVGVFFGITPAWQLASHRMAGVIRRTGRGTGEAGSRLRGALVIVEVALSVVLVAGASLLIRSFDRLRSEDPGFGVDGAVAARVQFPSASVGTPAVAAIDAMLERLRALPGAGAVGGINALPIAESSGDTRVYAADDPPASESEWRTALVRIVTPGYFEAMQIPVMRGRAIGASDRRGGELAAVINQSMADRFFPGQDPVGRELVAGIDQTNRFRVIGVVGDVRQFGLVWASLPEFYLPHAQVPNVAAMTLVVRVAGPTDGMITAVRTAIRAEDPNQPLPLLTSLEDVMSNAVAEPRFRTALLGGFAGMALLLAAMGVYGVLAYAVSRRTREFGVRMAIGARPLSVVRTIIVNGMLLIVTGLAAGIAVALASTRLLDSVLYDVEPRDAGSFAATAVVVLLAAVAATVLPALRAARVDPANALRAD